MRDGDARKVSFISTAFAACAVLVAGCAQHPTADSTAATASNMRLVGFNNLQGRSAYQPVVNQQNGRWILYVVTTAAHLKSRCGTTC